MGSVASANNSEEICDGCLRPFLDFQTDFVSHAGDNLCRWCRAIFWTATVLFEEDIEGEDLIIPTLTFAKYATGLPKYDELVKRGCDRGKPTPADLARILLEAGMISPGEMERGYLGWSFVKEIEGIPLIRVLPFTVFADEHTGTQVLKQVRVQILSKHADPKDVRECYEQLLAKRSIRWDDGASGCISHNFWGGYLDIRIRPTDELIYREVAIDRELIERYKDYFIRKAYPESYPTERPDDYPYSYPSPPVIEGFYRGLLGSLSKHKSSAHMLDLYGKSLGKTAEKLIPAFAAWHVGCGPGGNIPPHQRARVSRILNKHLLKPCGKQELPEDGWRTDDTVWKDVRDLAERFERLRLAGAHKPHTTEWRAHTSLRHFYGRKDVQQRP